MTSCCTPEQYRSFHTPRAINLCHTSAGSKFAESIQFSARLVHVAQNIILAAVELVPRWSQTKRIQEQCPPALKPTGQNRSFCYCLVAPQLRYIRSVLIGFYLSGVQHIRNPNLAKISILCNWKRELCRWEDVVETLLSSDRRTRLYSEGSFARRESGAWRRRHRGCHTASHNTICESRSEKNCAMRQVFQVEGWKQRCEGN